MLEISYGFKGDKTASLAEGENRYRGRSCRGVWEPAKKGRRAERNSISFHKKGARLRRAKRTISAKD